MHTYKEDRKRKRRLLVFDQKLLPGMVLLGSYRYDRNNSPLPFHTHEGIMEICFLETGFQNYVLDHEVYRLKGGEVFVAFPGESHGTGQYVEEKGCLYWLQIQLEQLTKPLLNLNATRSAYFIKKLKSITHRHCVANMAWKETLEGIFRSYLKQEPEITDIEMTQKILALLLLLLEDSQKGGKSITSLEIDKAYEYIRSHIKSPISVEEVASFVHLSTSHFKSVFKQATGVSPGDFIQRQRIEAVCLQLRDSQLSITEIAMNHSFSNSQYLAAVFKKYKGCTPSEYRTKVNEQRRLI